MSSAAHSDRAKEQIACKVFIQCIKHTAAQSKLSVPLFLYLRNRFSMEKGTGHSKQVHTVETTVPKPPKIFNDHRACV